MRVIHLLTIAPLAGSALVRAASPQILPDFRIPIRSPGDPTITLPAAAENSGLPLTWNVAAGPVTVSGDTATLTGALGGVTLRATQPGNAEWEPMERYVTFPVTEDGGFREVSGLMGNHRGLDGIKAITRHGMLMAWQHTLNQPERRRVRPDIRWKTVSAGDHTVAIAEDGSLWAWGNGSEGQLGAGPGLTHSATPVRVGSDTDWWKIATMRGNTFALKKDGSLWRWGHLMPEPFFEPKLVDGGRDWRDIAGSQWHYGNTLRKENGSLAFFASDYSTTPGPSPHFGSPGSGWARISGAFIIPMGIKTDGTLWQITTFSRRVNADTDWVDVSSGRSRYLALRSDGSLWSDKTPESGTAAPVPRRLAPDRKWAKILAGYSASALIDAEGGLWMLGNSPDARPAAGETVTEVRVEAGSSLTERLYRVAPDYFPQTLSFLENRERAVPVEVGATLRAGPRECSSGMPPEITLLSGPATLAGDLITFTAEGRVEAVFRRPRDGTWSALDERVTFDVGPPRPELSVHAGSRPDIPPVSTASAVIRLRDQPRAVARRGETRSFTLLNTGTKPLNLTNITSEAESGLRFSTGSSTPAAIAPGESLRLELTLRAEEYGFHTLTVLLHTNDADESVFPLRFSMLVTNSPPVASAGPDRTVPAGRPVRLDADFFTDDTGKDIAPLDYAWDLDGGGFTRAGAEQVVLLSRAGQTLTARLRVRDADGEESFASCVLTACAPGMTPPAAILRKPPNDIQLVFPGEPGARYLLQKSRDLQTWGCHTPEHADAEWFTCGPDGFFAARVEAAPGSPREFYRVCDPR